MKYKIPIAILFVFVGIVYVRWEVSYPPEWNQIHPGISRYEVYQLIGAGQGEFSGWKGPFWRSTKGLVWYELELSMNGDKVGFVHIHRSLGEHSPF